MDASGGDGNMDRRGFLGSVAAAGMGMAMGPMVVEADEGAGGGEEIRLALIGCGTQGMTLAQAMMGLRAGREAMRGVRIAAVCDIWEDYALKRAVRILQAYKQEAAGYVDYQEMLAKEKGLDAVVVATPDVWHEEQAVACLEARLHVYCEESMAMTAAGARRMVAAAAKAGRLLQVGYCRRSDARYRFAYEKLIQGERLLGRIGIVNGQWNQYRYFNLPVGWPKGTEICGAMLSEFGYDSMEQLRNWRDSRRHSGGPLLNRASGQLDVFNWFLGTRPAGVLASGGRNFLNAAQSQWYDNVMAVLEYETADGAVRAYYQTIPMNSGGGRYEAFVGDEGTLIIDQGLSHATQVHRQPGLDTGQKWNRLVREGVLKSIGKEDVAAGEMSWPLYVDESPPPYKMQPYMLGLEDAEPFTMPHVGPHLENFFEAIRGRAELNCPGEAGFAALVTAGKVAQAMDDDGRIEVKRAEYEV